MLFQCSHCSFSCRDKKLFIKHARIHGSKLLKCPKCPESVTRAKFEHHLQTHISDKNNKKINLQCPCCDQKFSDFSIFNKHVRSFHEKERKICDICKDQKKLKIFHSWSRFYLHMKAHVKTFHVENYCSNEQPQDDSFSFHDEIIFETLPLQSL